MERFAAILLLAAFLLPHETNGIIKRCHICSSRGELGTCKDPYMPDQNELAKNIEPCASGWCGKVLEATPSDYSSFTRRICLPRAPPDNEERCGKVMTQSGKVFMCFCRGDLCNSAMHFTPRTALLMFLALVVKCVF